MLVKRILAGAVTAAALTLGTGGIAMADHNTGWQERISEQPAWLQEINRPDPGWHPGLSHDFDKWAAAGYPDGPGIEDGDQYTDGKPGRYEDGSGDASATPSQATDTGGMWVTLDRAIASGDPSAIQSAINDKGPDPAYHDRVVNQVAEKYPHLADKYGF